MHVSRSCFKRSGTCATVARLSIRSRMRKLFQRSARWASLMGFPLAVRAFGIHAPAAPTFFPVRGKSGFMDSALAICSHLPVR